MKSDDTWYGRLLWVAKGVARGHNRILAGLLAVQIILSLVVFWPRSAATGEAAPLFPDLEKDDVVGLTIADGDGNSVVLQKVQGEWVLPDAGDYPAQSDKVDTLVTKLASLTTGRLVTRTDASHRRLQVAEDDFVRRVDLESQDGTLRTLYLGSAPQYGATHFRRQGQSETYLTSELSTWDVGTNATAWVDTLYLSVPQEEVVQVTLENSSGTFAFGKEDAEAEDGGTWAMDGLAADEQLDSATVDTLLARVTSLRMTRPLGTVAEDSYGLQAPAAMVTLQTGDDETITLAVGAQDPADSSYVVKSSESAYYVRAAQYSVQDLVEWTRDDFLQAQPTPTPGPTVSP